MVEKRTPLPVAEAVERVLEHAMSLGAEKVELEESYGRILAEPIIASSDVPPFDRSPYDGFAIRSVDSTGASGDNRVAFNVIDHIGAGEVSTKKLAPFEAIRIMTGAQLPEEADAVVMFEQTVESVESVTIRKPFGAVENVSLQGEDLKKNEVVIASGSFINPGTIALLATFGYSQVAVSKQPVVGILSTGTELLSVGDDLAPGKIRNSNGPMIVAQLKRMGLHCKMYGMSIDQLDESYEVVKKAAAETDCLITTGGVSVGDFDFLPAIYERLGAEVLFNKVAMRPGSVTTVAVANGRYLFGLSGNPSACFTGFELFVRPALLKMMSASKLYLPHTTARLGEDFTKANPFTRFIRALYNGDTVSPAGFNKSNAVSSIARGNALIVLPGGTRGYQSGDAVDVLLLGVEEGSDRWTL
ncbi:molybdopterin biosynthesis protein moeA [Planococcus antarcticus DSM 14505]|uniref:Molybdopterin molybdenumtransferase n=1 Tax=Planococcus antarcticus DSM 14505 TaxID=1185653 RepID=A0A1C7DHP1_9BACL|nr:gephyrin-like molybdotransferase Glp [Planococcus antarcticus]ANU10932.1 molybdopterin molybdenumtransferase [Planococcus antarcticus DSM 14505]EIM05228.1 molybdopterin biosynthesis protein moeA [Planococcus antarcticus DSM 14505]